jgi:CubicO group peptidase (beta-lactamase class C family)
MHTAASNRPALLAMTTLLFGLVLSPAVRAQSVDPTARLPQVLQSVAERTGFIGTALVARGDTVLMHRGIGPATAEWGVGNGPEIKYLIASISKQFTAAAVLRLVDQGRLKIDDPVRQHLPELPAAWQAVTVRQLLAHTSGIPNHTEGEAFERGKSRAWTPRELLASFSKQPLEFVPGSRFRYSNSGYIVAGILIEQLSGLNYGDFLQREFFAPLGLSESGLAHSEAVTPKLASGYRRDPVAPNPVTARLMPSRALHMSVPYAAGALYSSTRDLWAWQRALYGGRVLTPASLALMTTVQHDRYALGISNIGSATAPVYGHSGGIDGFATYLLFDPRTQTTVAVLANVQGIEADRLAQQLAAVADGQRVVLPHERTRVELPVAELRPLEGAYQHPSADRIFWVALRGDTLWVRPGNHTWRAIVPVSRSEFHVPDVDSEMRFERDPSGRGLSMVLADDRDGARWQRVDQTLPTLVGQAVYLRGSPNEWQTRDVLQPQADGKLATTVSWPAGDHEFKLASADWKAIDLGQDGRVPALQSAGRVNLAAHGRNLMLRLSAPSRCQFSFDPRDVVQPTLDVSCQAAP